MLILPNPVTILATGFFILAKYGYESNQPEEVGDAGLI
jgi:hypothetical protein